MTDLLREARLSRGNFLRMMGGLAAATLATACSTRPETTTTTGTGSGGQSTTELKFIGVSDQKAAMDKLVADYQKARPAVRIFHDWLVGEAGAG